MTAQPPSDAQRQFGAFAPAFADLTDDVLYGQVWPRPELARRDRSLVTVAALVAGGNFEQLRFHLSYAIENGATREELIEAITHFAFYCGWPRAMSAMAVAKEVLGGGREVDSSEVSEPAHRPGEPSSTW